MGDPNSYCPDFYDEAELTVCEGSGHLLILHQILAVTGKTGHVLNHAEYCLNRAHQEWLLMVRYAM